MLLRTARSRHDARQTSNLTENPRFGAGEPPSPYFFVRRTGDEHVMEGQATCSLGHQIPRKELGISDGVFAAWTWDGKRLRVRNDRYGLFPLYYFSNAVSFGISPSIPRLVSLGAPTDLDHAALATFLQFDSFLGEDTPFRAIRALPPNAELFWE